MQKNLRIPLSVIHAYYVYISLCAGANIRLCMCVLVNVMLAHIYFIQFQSMQSISSMFFSSYHPINDVFVCVRCFCSIAIHNIRTDLILDPNALDSSLSAPCLIANIICVHVFMCVSTSTPCVPANLKHIAFSTCTHGNPRKDIILNSTIFMHMDLSSNIKCMNVDNG